MNFKKILSAVLAMVLMASSFASVNVFATANAESFTYQEERGDIGTPIEKTEEEYLNENFSFKQKDDGSLMLTKYLGSSKSVSIPDMAFLLPVTEIGESAFENCKNLERIDLCDTIQTIGQCAFSGCEKLNGIDLPSSLLKIGDLAFQGCTSLKYITISSNNAYYKSVDDVLFNKNLSEIVAYPAKKEAENYNIPNSVVSICPYAFYGCEILKQVSIPNSIKKIEKFNFVKCTALQNIDVTDGNKNFCDVNGVLFSKDMSMLLAYPAGKSETKYSIPNGVESIGSGAFSNNQQIKCVFAPESLTEIIYPEAFCNCKSLKSIMPIGMSSNSDEPIVYIPKLGILGDRALYGCDSLINVYVDYPTTFGQDVFTNCKNLKHYEICTDEIGGSCFFIDSMGLLKNEETGKCTYMSTDIHFTCHYGSLAYQFACVRAADYTLLDPDYEIKGDCNFDKKVNLLDLITLRKYLAKWNNVFIGKNAVDFDNNGKVNLLDLISLRRKLVGLSV